MIKIVKRLFEICNERRRGYETAANNVEDPAVAEVLRNLAIQSESFKGELIPYSSTLSSSEVEEHKVSDIFTDWMDFKSMITGGDSQTIISGCETGEKHAISAYEEVLENNMPDDLGSLVNNQLLQMKNALEVLDDLKQKVH